MKKMGNGPRGPDDAWPDAWPYAGRRGLRRQVENRQQNADQLFGNIKMAPVVASGLIDIYNLMPVCNDRSLPPRLCYSEPVGDILNKGLEATASAIESAEKVFAATNTERLHV
jgi:hypothetical protein